MKLVLVRCIQRILVFGVLTIGLLLQQWKYTISLAQAAQL
jgi:hypothetical protein